MAPVGEHGDQVFGNSPFGQKHLEDLVPKDRLQLFQVQGRSDPEHAPPVEASVRYQNMAVGVEAKEIARGLDGDDGTGDGIPLRHRLPKKELQRIPGAAAQIGKKIPVPRSGRGQASRKSHRRIFGILKTTCRWGTFLSTWEQSHCPNSTTRF